MKKTIFSKSWETAKLLPMIFGLVFMFVIGATSLNAQTAFVDPAAATAILKSEIVSLEAQFAGTNPNNNPSWEEQNNKVNYYARMVVLIGEGTTVKNAIFDGYAIVLGALPNLQSLTSADVYYTNLFTNGNPHNPTGSIDRLVGGTPSNNQSANNNLYLDSAIDLLKK